MRRVFLFPIALVVLASFPLHTVADIILGTAGDFAVLAGTTVTNTGSTFIDGGDVGVSPGTAITGFSTVDGGPGVIASPFGVFMDPASEAETAAADFLLAYDAAKALTPDMTLTGADLGGLTLTPGVYFFSSSAMLSGTLTLDYTSTPGGEFVFQVGSTLTTASDSSVVVLGSPTFPAGSNVFWQTGTAVTLGSGTDFLGHILAGTSITFSTGATDLGGSALAKAAVTLDTNTITNVTAVPEPASMTLFLVGSVMLGLRRLTARGESRPRP